MALQIDLKKIDAEQGAVPGDVEEIAITLAYAQAVSTKRIADALERIEQAYIKPGVWSMPAGLAQPVNVAPSMPVSDAPRGSLVSVRADIASDLKVLGLHTVISARDGGYLNAFEDSAGTAHFTEDVKPVFTITAEEARKDSWRARWSDFYQARITANVKGKAFGGADN